MKNVGITHADEHKILEFEVYLFKKKIAKMQKDFKFVVVTNVEFTYSEPVMAPVTLHWQFWKRWKKRKK